MWELFAGVPHLPFDLAVGTSTADYGAALADALPQAAWRQSTRIMYQGWVLLWLSFCAGLGVAAVPAVGAVLARFVSELAVTRAASTVSIACSAIVGLHKLNNFKSPFEKNPLAQLAWKAVEKTRSALRQKNAIKDGVDPDFIWRVWRYFMPMFLAGTISFEQAKLWCLIQVGWEAGNRPGEIGWLMGCDFVPVVLMGEAGCGDWLLWVRGAKNDAKFRGQCTRLMLTDASGTSPCAVWLFVHVYGPMLCAVIRGMGLHGLHCGGGCVAVCGGKVCLCARVHARCSAREVGFRTDAQRTHRCEWCRHLFPSRPLQGVNKGGLGMISKSLISEGLKRLASEFGLGHLRLSAKSLRIGGLSAATSAADGPGIGIVSQHMRWRSAVVPERHYKRQTPGEQQRTGQALHKALCTRSQGGDGALGMGSGASQPRAQVKIEPSLPPAGPAPSGQSVCTCCGQSFPTAQCAVYPGQLKRFCSACWASERARCKSILRLAVSSGAQGHGSPQEWPRVCPASGTPWSVGTLPQVAGRDTRAGFHMTFKVVGSPPVEICVPFQFGKCREGPSCKRAHVCSVHGVAHGRCAELCARVGLWEAADPIWQHGARIERW